MCGFVGLVNRRKDASILGPKEVEELHQAMFVMQHRGPDDSGVAGFTTTDGNIYEDNELLDKNVDGIIGFNRLSIKDLSIEGHQPMISRSTNSILVFNGEIYNDTELRKELLAKGYFFRGHSDTEVLLHLYEEYGFENMLSMLNGMFAIIIMDITNNILYMARDRFGVKPLYYGLQNGKCYFASELKSIIQFKKFKRELDFDAFNARLIFARPSSSVLLKGTKMLDPGTYVTITGEGCINQYKYFDINNITRDSEKYKNIDEAIEELDYILENAIKRQLVSDVKLGCQVSGGVDSTIVSYYAKKIKGEYVFDGVSMVDDKGNQGEEKYINEVGNRLNFDIHKFKIEEDYFIDNYEKLVWLNDAPLYKPYFAAFHKLAKYAKDYVTVLLSGEGADETAGGYSRFPAGVYQPFISKIGNENKIRVYDSYAEYEVLSDSTCLGCTILGYDNTADLVQQQIDIFNSYSGNNFSKQIKYETMQRLPESFMRQDKMTMANSIENRVPLVDNEVVDFLLKLPEEYLIAFGDSSPFNDNADPFSWIQGKYIYKKLLSDKFGHDFVYRKKTIMVFNDGDILKGKRFNNLFMEKIYPSMKKRQLVNAEKIKDLYLNIDEIGTASFNTMWRAIGLETWCQLFLDAAV